MTTTRPNTTSYTTLNEGKEPLVQAVFFELAAYLTDQHGANETKPGEKKQAAGDKDPFSVVITNPLHLPNQINSAPGELGQLQSKQAQLKTTPRLHHKRTIRDNWVAAGLPWPVGYVTYTFSQHDPKRNRHREYRVTYRNSLWQGYTVQRSWGRCGSQHPRHQDCSFESEEQALNYLRRLVLKRYRRGYTLNWCEGAIQIQDEGKLSGEPR